MIKEIVTLLAFTTVLASCSSSGDDPIVDNSDDSAVIVDKPNYTAGYSNVQVKFIDAQGFPPLTQKWELVNALTDEFDGDEINSEKWNDLHPVWAGRAPSAFKRENTTVGGGYLRLKSTSRVADLSEVANPEQDIWVDAASMTSKTKIAKPGYYYETSFKASDLSMTSSFWFRMGNFSEIDVIEHMGHSSIPGKDDDKAYEFHANTFYYGIHEGLDELPTEIQMDTRGRDEFHTYGLWWKDPKTLKFYHNGEEVMVISPRVDFDENLFLIFDTEVFIWDGLPTIESLNDDTKNTMLVDFVRTYELTDSSFDSGLLKNGSFEQNGIDSWLWKGEVSLNTVSTNLNDGIINLNLKNGGSIIQKVAVSKNTDYQLNWNATATNGSLKVEVIDIKEATSDSEEWTSENLSFNSGDATEVYIRITASAQSNNFIDALTLK